MRAPTVHAEQGSGQASIAFAQSERRISGVLYNSTGATVYVGTAETDDTEWFPIADGATYQHDSQGVLLVVAATGSTLPLTGLHTAEDRA